MAPLPTPSRKEFRGLPEFHAWRDYEIPPDVFNKPAQEEGRSPRTRAGPQSGNWPRLPVTPTQPRLSKSPWPGSPAWNSGLHRRSGGQTEGLSAVPGHGRPRAERAALWQCGRQPLEPDTSLRLGLGAHGEGPCSWPGGPRSQPVMPVSQRGSRDTEALQGQAGPRGLTLAQPGKARAGSVGWRPGGADPPKNIQGGSVQKTSSRGGARVPFPEQSQHPPPRPARREESRPSRSGEARAAGKTPRGGGPGRALTCPRRP